MSKSTSGMAAPSPGSLLNSASASTPTMGNAGHPVPPGIGDPIGGGLFGPDFMSSGLDDFGPEMFGRDDMSGMAGLNFDEWFNADSTVME